MAPHQFAVEMVEDLDDGEVAVIGRHLGVEQHLQQQIAQFFGQVRKVAPLDGVEDLVGFLKRVFADGVEALLAVPRAAVGSPQPRHDGRGLLKIAAARAASVAARARFVFVLEFGAFVPIQLQFSVETGSPPLPDWLCLPTPSAKDAEKMGHPIRL